MGFDMQLTKAKKHVLEKLLNKYYQESLNDLPYEAMEELNHHPESSSFTSRVNLLDNLNGLPYASETYAYLSKEDYERILSHCRKKINSSENTLERRECERLVSWMEALNPDWEKDEIIYEYDC